MSCNTRKPSAHELHPKGKPHELHEKGSAHELHPKGCPVELPPSLPTEGFFLFDGYDVDGMPNLLIDGAGNYLIDQ